MKAQAQGFVWQQQGAVTIDQFAAFIRTLIGSEIKFKGFKRLIYLKERDKYYVGLLLTIRDHKKYCELVDKGEGFEVVVNESEENARPMDFNFFVVNKATWRGLYLWYRGSCSLRQFGNFCKVQYNGCLTNQRDIELAELAELNDAKHHRKDERRIRRTYKSGQFSVDPLMMRGTIIQQLRRLREIKSVTWTYAVPKVNEGVFTSVKDRVVLERRHLTFNTQRSHVRQLRDLIASFFESGEASTGLVHGKDSQGHGDTVPLNPKPEIFGMWDYDTITNNEALDVTRVEDSPVLDLLLDTAADNNRIFEG